MKISRLRVILAAVLGSVVTLGAFIPYPVKIPLIPLLFLFFILALSLIVGISYRIQTFKQFGKLLLILVVFTVVIEGIGEAFFYLFRFNGKEICAWIIVFTSYLLIRLGIESVRIKKKQFYPIMIKQGDEEISLVALEDSGNLLEYNGQKVCVISPGIIQNINGNSEEKQEIEYTGADGNKGRWPLYQVDEIQIYTEYGKKTFYRQYVAENNTFPGNKGRFQMILPDIGTLTNKNKHE